MRLSVALLLILTMLSPLWPQAKESPSPHFQPNILPTLVIRPSQGPIHIDGELDDPGWQGAAMATNFSEIFPGDMTRPPIPIRAWLTYDEKALYVAFQVEDDPGLIRYSLRDRDQIMQDDLVGILLDTYGNGTWAYEIFANPLGVQGDILLNTSTGEDPGFDLIFHSRGKVTANGYQVEMAIPFRSLRFPNREEQVWRMTLVVIHPRDSRRQYSWAAISRDNPCLLCQLGYLKGIRGVQAGGNLELLPALVSSQSSALHNQNDPHSGLQHQAIRGEPSLGIKYSLSPTSIVDMTVNPDFSQVEADAEQIDVNTTFALFFPEKRPFFQEGSDLYRSWLNLVYTRMINNPIFAAKLTSRQNRLSLGFMGAVDESSPVLIPLEEQSTLLQAGRSISNILRLKHSFGEDSYIGLLATDRRLRRGGSHSLVSLDLRWQWKGRWQPYRLEAQWAFSRTQEPADTSLSAPVNGLPLGTTGYSADFDGESFVGQAAYVSFVREGRHLLGKATLEQFSPTFRADNGFIKQTNIRRLFLSGQVRFYPPLSLIDESNIRLFTGSIWNYSGVRKDRWALFMINSQLKGQTIVSVRYLWSRELFRGIDFPGIRRFSFAVESQAWSSFFWAVEGTLGRSIARTVDPPVLGRYRNLALWFALKPVPRFVWEWEYEFAEMRQPRGRETIFSGYILRTRLNYQFTRELFLRIFAQFNQFHDQLQIDPLLTYKLNAFSAFYLGSTHSFLNNTPEGNLIPTSRQFFLKFQYLFQL